MALRAVGEQSALADSLWRLAEHADVGRILAYHEAEERARAGMRAAEVELERLGVVFRDLSERIRDDADAAARLAKVEEAMASATGQEMAIALGIMAAMPAAEPPEPEPRPMSPVARDALETVQAMHEAARMEMPEAGPPLAIQNIRDEREQFARHGLEG